MCRKANMLLLLLPECDVKQPSVLVCSAMLCGARKESSNSFTHNLCLVNTSRVAQVPVFAFACARVCTLTCELCSNLCTSCAKFLFTSSSQLLLLGLFISSSLYSFLSLSLFFSNTESLVTDK